MRALLVLLPLLGATLAAGAGPTYTAEAYCAWDDATLKVLIVPPAPTYAVHNDGEDIDPPGSIVVAPEARAPWDSAHADAAARAVDDWVARAHAYAPHMSRFSMRWTIAGPAVDPNIATDADIVIVFSPVLESGGRAIVTCEPAIAVPNTRDLAFVGSYIIMNQWFLFSYTPTDTYNIVLHEIGHALGLEHIEDPPGDLMASVYPFLIGNLQNPTECISTLDLARLSANYQWLDRKTPFVRYPGPVAIPTSAYEMRC